MTRGLLGIEITPQAKSPDDFKHPAQAVYLLGAEDHGLTRAALGHCHQVVQLPSSYCLNVAVVGSLILYDRAVKLGYRQEETLIA